MKKLTLKKDVVAQLTTLNSIFAGAQPSGDQSCQKGICITPILPDPWIRVPTPDPIKLTEGKVTCRDSAPGDNRTMASCYYGC